MELLTCAVGETSLALISDQVTRVRRWEAADVVARRPLAQALGLAVDAPCARELVCASPRGEVAFGIPSAVIQRQAEEGSIVALSQVLRRLRAPAWLAGFFLSPASTGGGISLIVDLALLSQAAHPPQETAR